MNLVDRSSENTRNSHTLRHYFSLTEKYFEIHRGGFPVWHARWKTLQGANALDLNSWTEGITNPAALQTMKESHGEWVNCAQKAVDDAERSMRFFPLSLIKRFHVGRAGVVAITTACRGTTYLVTSFRCVPTSALKKRFPFSMEAWEAASAEKAETFRLAAVQAAVRRGSSRAFVKEEADRTSPNDGSQ